MTGNVINLNKVRKQRASKAKRAQADANSAKFGRTKADKKRDTAEADKAARDLDGHKREE